ncbi:Alanine racemase [hydrothermal vent metagenome]|uniref:Alanine racemase n=1 Tax=hydrothermal vent metagenome TaxID=652676 RepID=A0A3B1D3U0_9ZZZZ
MAVVKADAYGHGMIECVKAFETLGERKPAYYAVALLEEAIELRKARITQQPILCFAPLTKAELDEYIKYNVIATITDLDQLKFIEKHRSTKKFHIHINVDTGMGRVGIKFTEAVELILRLVKFKKVIIDGIYTHFATSDEKDKTFAELQLNRFLNILNELKELNINYGLVHTANSGAILDIPESYLDMVRSGISLYGYYPSTETSESIKLKPVMSIVSQVSTINAVEKGDSVSYGRKFVASKKTKIVSVAIGYADGIRRGLTNRMIGIIRDKKYHQVGTVTMDRIMFDVNDDNIKIRDKIILIGKSKNQEITAMDWCKILNTIPYEITCGIGKRVPRIYKY